MKQYSAIVAIAVLASCWSCADRPRERVVDPSVAAKSNVETKDHKEIGTWAEVIDASRKMEKELESIFKEYGFKRNKRFEAEQSEAGSYLRLYTAKVTDDQAPARIVKRLRAVSTAYVEDWGGVGWTSLNLDEQYPMPNVSKTLEFIGGVSLAPNGAKVFDVDGGERFMAIDVWHIFADPDNDASQRTRSAG